KIMRRGDPAVPTPLRRGRADGLRYAEMPRRVAPAEESRFGTRRSDFVDFHVRDGHNIGWLPMEHDFAKELTANQVPARLAQEGLGKSAPSPSLSSGNGSTGTRALHAN